MKNNFQVSVGRSLIRAWTTSGRCHNSFAKRSKGFRASHFKSNSTHILATLKLLDQCVRFWLVDLIISVRSRRSVKVLVKRASGVLFRSNIRQLPVFGADQFIFKKPFANSACHLICGGPLGLHKWLHHSLALIFIISENNCSALITQIVANSLPRYVSTNVYYVSNAVEHKHSTSLLLSAPFLEISHKFYYRY